jgi:hypothetical protein
MRKEYWFLRRPRPARLPDEFRILEVLFAFFRFEQQKAFCFDLRVAGLRFCRAGTHEEVIAPETSTTQSEFVSFPQEQQSHLNQGQKQEIWQAGEIQKRQGPPIEPSRCVQPWTAGDNEQSRTGDSAGPDQS